MLINLIGSDGHKVSSMRSIEQSLGGQGGLWAINGVRYLGKAKMKEIW